GPDRRPARGRLWTVAVAAAVGFCAWQFVAGLYMARLVAQWKAAGIENIGERAKDLLTPKDFAFLATVPPTVAFVVMLACDALFAPGNLTAIGFRITGFLRGVVMGIVAFLVIGPMMVWVLQLLELAYRAARYEHPTEHVLLKSLGQ